MKKVNKSLCQLAAALGLTAAVLFGAAGESGAYERLTGAQIKSQGNGCTGDIEWPGTSKTFYRHPNTFPNGTTYTDGLMVALGRVNSGPHDFTVMIWVGDNNVASNNGRSEVYFTPNASADGQALIWANSSCRIIETDVVFKSNEFTPSMQADVLHPYRAKQKPPDAVPDRRGDSQRPFLTTVIHELGHALGLAHVNYCYNVMGRDWTHVYRNGNMAYSGLGEDAASGAVNIYGLRSNNYQDLGLTHWRQVNYPSSYSRHTRTKLTKSGNGSLPVEYGPVTQSGVKKVRFKGEHVFEVERGQAIKAWYMPENNGKSTQYNVKINWYLSADDTITTGDLKIDTQVVPSISRGNPVEDSHTLTIPSNAPLGYRWLGAIVDPLDALKNERHEDNNVATWAIKVVKP